jgi:Zn-finger in Ran binding protein and others
LAAVPTRRSPQTPTLDLPSINGSKSVVSAEQNSKSSPVIVEDIDDDDDDDRVAKKQKMTPVNESTITVEEMDDIDMPSTSQSLFTQSVEIIEPDDDAGGSMADHTGFPASSTATSPVKSSFILKSSAPKEPSKLRFSYKGDASPPLTTPSPSFDPPPTPKVAHAELPGIVPTISKEVVITDPQRVVIAMAVHDLPIYSFLQPGLGARAGIDYLEGAQAAAKAMPTLLLPTFDFSMRAAEANAGRSTSSTVSGGGAAAPVTKGFDWAAAGLKAPSAAGTWICSLCMLSNPATANKCTVCETLR